MILISILITLMILIPGCKKTPTNMPSYRPDLYAGSSKDAALVRKQSNEVIPATSIEFDGYVCMKYKDLSCTVETYIDNCTAYKSSKVDCSNVSTDDIKRLINKHY